MHTESLYMKPGHAYIRKMGNSSIICTLQCYLYLYMSVVV